MLRNTIERLIDDCERRQALVQELITSSNKLQLVCFVFLVVVFWKILLSLQSHLELKQIEIRLSQNIILSACHQQIMIYNDC